MSRIMQSSTFLSADGLKLLYCRNAEECELGAKNILRSISQQPWSTWGFDVEWPVTFQRGSKIQVALIQFANDKIAYLFHVHFSRLTPSLIQLLKHPYIFKVGINISNDATHLMKTFPSELGSDVHGIVEIRNIAKEYIPGTLAAAGSTSLASLTRYFLGKELEKPADIRTGAWDKYLGPDQKRYAALDAVASYLVFQAVMKESYTSLIEDENTYTINPAAIRNIVTTNAENLINLRDGGVHNEHHKSQWEIDTLKWHSKVYCQRLPSVEDKFGIVSVACAVSVSDRGGRGGAYGLCRNAAGFCGDYRPLRASVVANLLALIRGQENAICDAMFSPTKRSQTKDNTALDRCRPSLPLSEYAVGSLAALIDALCRTGSMYPSVPFPTTAIASEKTVPVTSTTANAPLSVSVPASAPVHVSMLILTESAASAVQLEAACRILCVGTGIKTQLAVSKASGGSSRIDSIEKRLINEGCDILVSCWSTMSALLNRSSDSDEKLSFTYTQFIIFDARRERNKSTNRHGDNNDNNDNNEEEVYIEEDSDVQILGQSTEENSKNEEANVVNTNGEIEGEEGEDEVDGDEVEFKCKGSVFDMLCNPEVFCNVRGTYILDDNSSVEPSVTGIGLGVVDECAGIRASVCSPKSPSRTVLPSAPHTSPSPSQSLSQRPSALKKHYLAYPLLHYSDFEEVRGAWLRTLLGHNEKVTTATGIGIGSAGVLGVRAVSGAITGTRIMSLSVGAVVRNYRLLYPTPSVIRENSLDLRGIEVNTGTGTGTDSRGLGADANAVTGGGSAVDFDTNHESVSTSACANAMSSAVKQTYTAGAQTVFTGAAFTQNHNHNHSNNNGHSNSNGNNNSQNHRTLTAEERVRVERNRRAALEKRERLRAQSNPHPYNYPYPYPYPSNNTDSPSNPAPSPPFTTTSEAILATAGVTTTTTSASATTVSVSATMAQSRVGPFSSPDRPNNSISISASGSTNNNNNNSCSNSCGNNSSSSSNSSSNSSSGSAPTNEILTSRPIELTAEQRARVERNRQAALQRQAAHTMQIQMQSQGQFSG